MANRFSTPILQFADTTGLPYAGGSLTFTASGTSTPLATYSDRALTIPNTNPVVLDSAGRSGNIFLQNLAYKVVLADLNSNVIWTEDPVYASDFSTTASFLSGAGSPNGNTAGSQGSPTVPASVYWDTTNNILYVCTTTGTTTTAVWTAVNSSTAAAVVPPPQGYLTPTTGVPIISGDSVAATSLFYTPYIGNLVPIYNGSSFVPTTFTELQLTLNAAHVASNIYDVFVFNNSGVPTVVTGPSWSGGTAGSITAGSCARGTGVGGAALTRVNGIWTNTVQITGRNGATTYTINANLATYVGSLFMDAVNGQITCHRTVGASRKWGIWNAYNRAQIVLDAADASGGPWSAPAAWRQSDGSTNNKVTTFCGLAEEEIDCSFVQKISSVVAGSNTNSVEIGIGVNSTVATTGSLGSLTFANNSAVVLTPTSNAVATCVIAPAIGINNVNALEQAPANAASSNLFGTSSYMNLFAKWRG